MTIGMHTLNMYQRKFHCENYIIQVRVFYAPIHYDVISELGGMMLNRTKPQMYITEKIRIVHVFLPQAKQHAELKNGFADFMKHI